MYSLILMTAMAGTPDTTEFNGFFRNLFSFSGCRGSCYGSCSGRTSGCTGSCHGQEFGSRMRAFNGSCTGRGYACSGSSYSCSGYSHSCNGGVLRDSPFSDGFALPGPATSILDAPAQPSPAIPPLTVPESRRISFAPPLSSSTGRATVVVKLPADATLYAEGQRLALTSAERSFVTPPLPLHEDYSYAFRVEYVRGGETISQSKKASVRAGTTTTIEFLDLTLAKANKEPADAKTASIPLATSAPSIPAPAGLASAKPDRARITVKLPPGATLYVDGKKNERADAVREFNTPPLPQGQEFAYQMKAEVMRNGHPETQTTTVNVRAGELVSVDFTAK